MIPGLYTYAATAVVAGSLAFGAGWSIKGWERDAADKARTEADAVLKDKQVVKADTASTGFEGKRNTNEIRYRITKVTVERLVDRPVYLNVCLADDGLRVLNSQINRSADPGEPQLKLPKS